MGDSFANLPSPVQEGQTVKNFFRFNEEEDNEKRLERENRERNEIRIEGKSDRKNKKEDEKKEKSQKGKGLKIDIKEIDKIVFSSNPKSSPLVAATEKEMDNDPYTDLSDTKFIKSHLELMDESIDQSLRSIDNHFVNRNGKVNN